MTDEPMLPFDYNKNLQIIKDNGHSFYLYQYDRIKVIVDDDTGYFNLMFWCNHYHKSYKNIKCQRWYRDMKRAFQFSFNDGHQSLPEGRAGLLFQRSLSYSYKIDNVKPHLQGPYVHPTFGYAVIDRFDSRDAYIMHRMFEMLRTDELIEKSVPKQAIISPTDDVFTDPTSGKQFKRYRYFDHIVIQDIETGLINAGKFVMDIARAQGISKELKDFKATSDYQICLEIQARNKTQGNPLGISDDGFITYNQGYSDAVRGTYVPFRCFQLVALWADKRHKLEVLELLESINNKANEAHKSAYDEIKRLNNQLQEEIEQLKSANEKLIEENRSLNLPINKSIPTTIYAKQVDESHFQLKHSKVSPSRKVKSLKKTEVINGKDVRDLTIKKLTKEGLVETKNRKKIISTEQLDHCFNTIVTVKENKPEIVSIEEKNTFIDAEISKWKSLPQNQTTKGKLFELEYIKSMPDLIPWRLIPQSVLNIYNEQSRDTGVDAVKIKDGNIVELYQIKHHNGTKLTYNEIEQFINKKILAKKILILKDCIIDKKIELLLTENNIHVEICS